MQTAEGRLHRHAQNFGALLRACRTLGKKAGHSDARGEITLDSNNLLVATQEGGGGSSSEAGKERFMRRQCRGFENADEET